MPSECSNVLKDVLAADLSGSVVDTVDPDLDVSLEGWTSCNVQS